LDIVERILGLSVVALAIAVAVRAVDPELALLVVCVGIDDLREQ